MAEMEQVLRGLCEDLLEKMAVVSEAAVAGLRDALPGDANAALAAPGNAMTGDSTAMRLYEGRQLLHLNQQRVVTEPFVARVHVRVDGRERLIYITRGASPGGILGRGISLATYASPLGKLAEREIGELVEINDKEYEILGRTFVMPKRRDRWDGEVDRVELGREGWRGSVGWLRRYLEGAQADKQARDEDPERALIAQLLGEQRRSMASQEQRTRRLLERMTLRDQPTLDRYQGEVFRLPLERSLMLLGPPGSGKTTTLVQRLSQKLKQDGLDSAEAARLQQLGLGVSMTIQRSWMMFSPTELLQLYLRESLNREQVPAEASNLRIWERERRALGRDVFRLLRSGSGGQGFVLVEERFLLDERSEQLSAMHDMFAKFYGEALLRDLEERFAALDHVEDGATRRLVGRARSLVGGERNMKAQDLARLLELSDELREAQQRLKESADELVVRAAGELLRVAPAVLVDLEVALPRLRAAQDGELEDEEEERVVRSGDRAEALHFLFIGLRALARQRSGGARAGREARVVLEIIGDREPEVWSLEELGRLNRTVAALKRLAEAPQRSVMGLAAYYKAFREQHLELYVQGVEAGKISGAELDVLLLVALRGSRRLFKENQSRLAIGQVPDWLERVRARYVLQVFVDEATDFSAVQLGCMMELCHPLMRSWFACGDFKQRLTAHGIQSAAELEWLGRRVAQRIEVRDISTGYRQSQRLVAFTSALDGADVPPAATEEPAILLGRGLSDAALGSWLGARISEVERAVGRLPSIAIFVDGDERIDALLRELEPTLSAQNISVVGCKEGRAIGDAQEVRIFDIKHIKGLEFEAVFFVGVDTLAARLPELFDRYLYVGATRAATYLGVTTAKELPPQLMRVSAHLSTGGGWAS